MNCDDFGQCVKNFRVDSSVMSEFTDSVKSQTIDWLKNNSENFDISDYSEEELSELVKTCIVANLVSPRDLSNVDYDVRYSFNNLSEWFTMIVCDRCWDWYYLVDIIEKKVNLMREYLDGRTDCDNSKARKELRELSSACRGLKFADADYRPSGTDYIANKEFALRRFRRAFKGLFGWWD